MNKKYCIICGLSVMLGLVSSNLNAQWESSWGNIHYVGGNVGIGTISPREKLEINGKIFLNIFDSQNSWGSSYLQWDGHSLVMGSPSGRHAYNSVDLKPGGAEQGRLYSQFRLYTALGPNQQELKVSINSDHGSFFNNGNFGIGTSTPTSKLTVAGDIRAREIKVEANAGADFVFADDYRLRSLHEVEQFIVENKHLPDIAPADSMVQHGVDVGGMQIRLLQKVEELTLYVIELEKRVNELETNKE